MERGGASVAGPPKRGKALLCSPGTWPVRLAKALRLAALDRGKASIVAQDTSRLPAAAEALARAGGAVGGEHVLLFQP